MGQSRRTGALDEELQIGSSLLGVRAVLGSPSKAVCSCIGTIACRLPSHDPTADGLQGQISVILPLTQPLGRQVGVLLDI